MRMNDQDLIRLGMFTNELQNLQRTYGFWIQGAEVFIPSQTDPIARLDAGGGSYCVQLLNYPVEKTVK